MIKLGFNSTLGNEFHPIYSADDFGATYANQIALPQVYNIPEK